jgi:hypothetical protein
MNTGEPALDPSVSIRDIRGENLDPILTPYLAECLSISIAIGPPIFITELRELGDGDEPEAGQCSPGQSADESA